MVPLREWLTPPRTLLLLLFLLTLVSVSTLALFGWRLLEPQRMVEAQRSEERLEQAADRITAVVREGPAESSERLGAGLVSTGESLAVQRCRIAASLSDFRFLLAGLSLGRCRSHSRNHSSPDREDPLRRPHRRGGSGAANPRMLRK